MITNAQISFCVGERFRNQTHAKVAQTARAGVLAGKFYTVV